MTTELSDALAMMRSLQTSLTTATLPLVPGSTVTVALATQALGARDSADASLTAVDARINLMVTEGPSDASPAATIAWFATLTDDVARASGLFEVRIAAAGMLKNMEGNP